MRSLYLVFIAFFAISFSACGGGSGGGSSDKPVDVVFVDGYVANATLSDEDNTPVKYRPEEKVYHFYDTPKGYIKASGGIFSESGLENKMIYMLPADTKVISPVSQFLHLYPDLKEIISKSLNVSQNTLLNDFIKNKNLKVAKLAQIIYALGINNLLDSFSSNLKETQDLNGMILAALKTISGHSNKEKIENFLLSIDNVDDVNTIESQLYDKKKIMQENVNKEDIIIPTLNEGNSKNKLSVSRVDPIGNLKIKVDFSESVKIDSEEKKKAFILKKQTEKNIEVDTKSDNPLILNTTSITLPLSKAISTENKNNTYVVTVSSNFTSKGGQKLTKTSVPVSLTPEKLAVENITFKDGKTIYVTFNVAVDANSLRTNDFVVNNGEVSYVTSMLKLDENDEKKVIISLGNTLTRNSNYELQIKKGALQNKTNSYTLQEDIKKEFVALNNEKTSSNDEFNLISASVDSQQKNIQLNFSKNIMDNPNKAMFKVTLKQLSEPLQIEISQDDSSLRSVYIKPSSALESLEDRSVSYVLNITKQIIFSIDGSRTLGQTYTRNFFITDYPKVTSAVLNKNKIDIFFNMNMNLTADFVSVLEDNAKVDVTLSKGSKQYTINKKDKKDFKENTKLIIKSGVKSSDEKSALSSDFTKTFNEKK